MIDFDGIMKMGENVKLPSKSAIYYIVQISEIAYIGQTENMNVRFGNHHRISDFLDIDNAYVCWVETDPNVLLQKEKEEIANHAPCLNSQPGPKPRYDEPTERTTIRFPKSLKEEIEKAADAADTSINEWVLDACRRLIAADMPD